MRRTLIRRATSASMSPAAANCRSMASASCGPLTSVPEPSVWALGALGLIPAPWSARKR
jgi:hypothetical protein